MSSKHFCLKWNSFQSSILSAFESLQNSEDLADVTLTCEGINLKAHKFILSACSPYFRTVFKENPCPHPIVILKDVAYTDLIAIVNFMYHGEVMVSEEQLSSFLQTATILQVSGLINSNDNVSKKAPLVAKKSKTVRNNEHEPVKKLKTASKPKPVPIEQEAPKDSPEPNLVKIKTEDEAEIEVTEEQFCPDVNENMEVLEKIESQGSILEAALELREKPSSILERSLMSSKSPSSVPFVSEKHVIQNQTVFLPPKPPEIELERRYFRSSSGSSSPSAFDRPSELLQQSITIEGESYDGSEIMSPEEREGGRGLDVQPHHSSQCGNCPHCGKVYSNQSALKYHVRLVHSDLTNMYCCHLCPESFDYREGYKKHMAEVHFIRN